MRPRCGRRSQGRAGRRLHRRPALTRTRRRDLQRDQRPRLRRQRPGRRFQASHRRQADLGGLVAFDKRRTYLALRGSLASRGARVELGAVSAADDPPAAALEARSGAASSSPPLGFSPINASEGDPLVRPWASRRRSAPTPAARSPSIAPADRSIPTARAPSISPWPAAACRQAKVSATRYRLTPAGCTALTSSRRSGSFAPAQDAGLDAAGRAAPSRAARVDFVASRCAVVTAGSVELGAERRPEDRRPVLPPRPRRCSACGTAAGACAARPRPPAPSIPFLEAKVSEASGADRSHRPRGAADPGTRSTSLGPHRRHRPPRPASGPIAEQASIRAAGRRLDGVISTVARLAGRHLVDAQSCARTRTVAARSLFDTGATSLRAGRDSQPANLSPWPPSIASPATGGPVPGRPMTWTPDETAPAAGP